MFKQLFISFTALFVLIASFNASAQSVSEDIYIYMLTGPSSQFRILGSLKAGEAISATGEASGEYSQIKDARNRLGWIKTEHLSQGESFRTTVPRLQSQVSQLQADLTRITEERNTLNQESRSHQSEARSQISTVKSLEAENTQLKKELSSLRQDERWLWMQQGGIVAGAGLLVGLILAYIPRPKRKRKNEQWR